jgi:hypothetical protein
MVRERIDRIVVWRRTILRGENAESKLFLPTTETNLKRQYQSSACNDARDLRED